MSHAHSLATLVGPTQGCWDNESHYVPVNSSLIFVYSVTLMNWEKKRRKKEKEKKKTPFPSPEQKWGGKKKIISISISLSIYKNKNWPNTVNSLAHLQEYIWLQLLYINNISSPFKVSSLHEYVSSQQCISNRSGHLNLMLCTTVKNLNHSYWRGGQKT